MLCRCKYSVNASTVQPAVMWLTVSWVLPQTLQFPSICFFKILRWWYLVLSVWSCAAMIKLSVSPLSPALLNQAHLASLSTKGFSRLQKNCPCIGICRRFSILSFSMLSFSITFAGVWTADKRKYLFFIAFASFKRYYFAFPEPHAFFFLQTCKTCLCLAQYNHSNWPWSSCKQTSIEQVPYLHCAS